MDLKSVVDALMQAGVPSLVIGLLCLVAILVWALIKLIEKLIQQNNSNFPRPIHHSEGARIVINYPKILPEVDLSQVESDSAFSERSYVAGASVNVSSELRELRLMARPEDEVMFGDVASSR